MRTHESYEGAVQKKCKSYDRADRIKIAERFGGVITADHRVLIEEQESGLHHEFAVVVQDLATQWIESYPCKTTSAQETQRGLRTFFTYGQIFGFIEVCEELDRNCARSTLRRSETNGIAEVLCLSSNCA